MSTVDNFSYLLFTLLQLPQKPLFEIDWLCFCTCSRGVRLERLNCSAIFSKLKPSSMYSLIISACFFIAHSSECSPILTFIQFFTIFYFDSDSFEDVFFFCFMPLMKNKIAKTQGSFSCYYEDVLWFYVADC